jgi:predicted RNase H-like nuclease (RuvC/YqgF family)
MDNAQLAVAAVIAGGLITLMIRDFFLTPKNDIKDLKSEIKSLTIAVVKLESTISHYDEKMEKIPKLEKDLHEAHRKIREL